MSDSEIPQIPVKRKRGRPRIDQSKRVGPKVAKGKWEPTKWQPEYDTIIALSCIGYSHSDISQKMEKDYGIRYTPQHVCNIINTEAGKKVKEIIIARNRDTLLTTVSTNLEDSSVLAAQKIKKLLEREDLGISEEIRVANFALKVLDGAGKTKSPSNGGGNTSIVNNQQNNILISKEGAKDLLEGLRKSMEVDRIHGPLGTEVKLIGDKK